MWKTSARLSMRKSVTGAAGPCPHVRLDAWVRGEKLENLPLREILDRLRGLDDRQRTGQPRASTTRSATAS